jgi:hypothetical protein
MSERHRSKLCSVERSLSIAKLPRGNDLDEFDFTRIPINQTLVRELTTAAIQPRPHPRQSGPPSRSHKASRRVSSWRHGIQLRVSHGPPSVWASPSSFFRRTGPCMPRTSQLAIGNWWQALLSADVVDDLQHSLAVGAVLNTEF